MYCTSAAPLTTASVARLVLAPGLFSMMNGWPPLRQALADQACNEIPRSSGWISEPAASDKPAPVRSATRPGARQRPLQDAKMRGAEISLLSLSGMLTTKGLHSAFD